MRPRSYQENVESIDWAEEFRLFRKYDWRKLNKIQLGRYAEYFVKMEFALLGFDVYVPEVDDHGIDFVIRKDERKYYDIQVKSRRGLKPLIIRQDKFAPRRNLYAAVVIFHSGSLPNLYLIPSMQWDLSHRLRSGTYWSNRLFVSHRIGGKGKSTWGLNISSRNEQRLEKFEFRKMAKKL